MRLRHLGQNRNCQQAFWGFWSGIHTRVLTTCWEKILLDQVFTKNVINPHAAHPSHGLLKSVIWLITQAIQGQKRPVKNVWRLLCSAVRKSVVRSWPEDDKSYVCRLSFIDGCEQNIALCSKTEQKGQKGRVQGNKYFFPKSCCKSQNKHFSSQKREKKFSTCSTVA